jgi:hypothetical protein
VTGVCNVRFDSAPCSGTLACIMTLFTNVVTVSSITWMGMCGVLYVDMLMSLYMIKVRMRVVSGNHSRTEILLCVY